MYSSFKGVLLCKKEVAVIQNGVVYAVSLLLRDIQYKSATQQAMPKV